MDTTKLQGAMDAIGRELLGLALIGLDGWLWYVGKDSAAQMVFTAVAGYLGIYTFSKSP